MGRVGGCERQAHAYSVSVWLKKAVVLISGFAEAVFPGTESHREGTVCEAIL